MRRNLMGPTPARVMRAAIAVAMAAGMTAAVPAAVAQAAPRKFVPPAVQKVPVLPRTALAVPAAGTQAREQVSAATAAELRANTAPRPDSAWPAASTAVAALPVMPSRITVAAQRAADAAVPAGTLPVAVARDGAAGASLSRVSVSMLAHAAAARAGVGGVLFTVGEAGASRGAVSVTLRYSSFENAIGADWGYRLHLAELPACALTAPQVPACQVQTPVKTVNDPRAGTLTAQVTLAEPVQAGLAGVPGGPAAGVPGAAPRPGSDRRGVGPGGQQWQLRGNVPEAVRYLDGRRVVG